MVAASAGLQFLLSALLIQAFGAYVAVLSAEFGWSRTALAGGAAIQSIEGALIGPLLGWLVDRFGPRAVVRAGVLTFAVGFLGFSAVSSIAGFYVAVTVIAVGASMSGYFPLSIALMHFFERRRARALSLMSLGLAAGGLALPLLGWSIAGFGWRATCVGAAAVILIVGWPLASMLRRHPSELGLQVDGEPAALPAQPVASAGRAAFGAAASAAAAGSAAPARPLPAAGMGAREALRTPAFWLLAFGHALALLVVTAVNVHAISHMKQQLGYSLPQASFIITLMTLAQGAGMLLGAAVGDRWSKTRLAALCMLAHMVGLLMLAYAVHGWMLGVFAVLHGMAWGLRGPLMQALRADYFGVRAIGMIMGLSAVVISLGQVVGPLVAGMAYDATGHYRHGFLVIALMAGAGSWMFLRARRPE
ncbi:MAG: putative sialic acid transporter [Pseudomonadota bacterium]